MLTPLGWCPATQEIGGRRERERERERERVRKRFALQTLSVRRLYKSSTVQYKSLTNYPSARPNKQYLSRIFTPPQPLSHEIQKPRFSSLYSVLLSIPFPRPEVQTKQMPLCMYVFMYVCMHACMYVCMYACVLVLYNTPAAVDVYCNYRRPEHNQIEDQKWEVFENR